MVTIDRHKVFVSYHHDYDEDYKEIFCKKLGPDIVDKSVEDGDIDPDLNTDTIRRKSEMTSLQTRQWRSSW